MDDEQQQPPPPFHGHYTHTGQPVLTGTSS